MSADDLVIVDLADDNVQLRQLANAYRAEAVEAIERLGEKMRELETAHRTIAHLREQLRLAREQAAA